MTRIRDDLKVWARPGLFLLVEIIRVQCNFLGDEDRGTQSLGNQLSLPTDGIQAAAFVLWFNRDSVHSEFLFGGEILSCLP